MRGIGLLNSASAISFVLRGNYVNYFSLAGRLYKVIPQVLQTDRLNPSQVLDYYLRRSDGGVILATTVTHLKQNVVPESIHHFQQLNSATISGVVAPGISQGEVLDSGARRPRMPGPPATRRTTRGCRGSSCRSRAASWSR